MADAGENRQEAQRRSDEAERRSNEELKGRTTDLSADQRNKKREGEDTHGQENSQKQRPLAIGSIPSFDSSKEKMKVNEKGRAQSSKEDCQHYLNTGWCKFGRNCRYNHPLELPETTRIQLCKFFLEGYCRRGLDCRFHHKKREEIPENRRVDAQENLQEQNKRQRTEAQDNVQENQNLGAQDNLQEMAANQNVDAHHDQQTQIDIQKQRMEARLSLDQIKPTVEFNDLSEMRKLIGELGIERKENDGF